VTVVDLRVWQVPAVLPALGRMATGRRALRGTPGLRFAKLLGTGAGRTFTPRDADPHRWALLTVWDDAAAAEAHAGSRLVRGWDDASRERLSVRMTPVSSRGRWSGREPFGDVAARPPTYDGPLAVITRARLRTSRTLSFWRAVPPVVADLDRAPGCRLAIGIGEAPVGLQGTFSLWRSGADVDDFAYRTAHRDAIRQTRPERWYVEELFARLRVLDVEGTHRGSRP
jgi:heme-degrading monooxygenase HmoA